MPKAQPVPPARRTMPVAASALLLDSVGWLGGMVVAVWCRYEFDLTRANLSGAVTAGLLAVCVHAVVGHARYLYRGRHPSGTVEEVRALTTTVLGTTAVILAIDIALPVRLVPASSPIIGGLLALVLMFGGRYAHRRRYERHLRPQEAAPALLFGAGVAGHDLTRAMLRDQQSPYVPVGLLDDDPDKRNLRVYGVPVLGGREDIPAAVAATGASTVVFAVANAQATLLQDVQRRALQAGTAFKVVPSVGEVLSARVSVADVRDMEVSDLLGRRQVDTDVAGMAGYLKGKRVLVTGAGGSIGSELCRQIQRFGPSELMMLDRDESALHAVQLSLEGKALLDSGDVILADLRDEAVVAEIFAERAPQVVFHAAALKHLPLLERYPGEAVKTNVWGTLHVLTHAHGVERFVNISTDKAANPISVLGYSKRITERLTAHAATVSEGTFLNVRFGNVLGSRGSVLTTFRAQVAAGGPITVTHPDVTRYFMTVQEAVQLVIQAAALGDDGEALVLDMGAPVRIADVAQQMAWQAERPTRIVYTGLRPGEKLTEHLFGDGERDVRPRHPLISHVAVEPLPPDAARSLNPGIPADRLVAELAALCTATADVHAARTPVPAQTPATLQGRAPS